MDFSRFKVITFDCYGTLIDWETGIFGALRPVLGAHGKQLSDSELLQLYAELEADAESGKHVGMLVGKALGAVELGQHRLGTTQQGLIIHTAIVARSRARGTEAIGAGLPP